MVSVVLFPKGQIETIIKKGKEIKLSKEEIENTKEKGIYYTKQEKELFKHANKDSYSQSSTRPLFYNARTRKCTNKGDALFNPSQSAGKVKETNGKTIYSNYEHSKRYTETKKSKPSKLAMSWRK